MLTGATLGLIETSGTFELRGEKASKCLRQKLRIGTLQPGSRDQQERSNLGRAGKEELTD